jgi:phage shock protein C
MNDRFLLNRREGKIMGVAAGLSDLTGVDALIIRLGLVAALLLTGPVVVLFYVLTGWLGSARC